MARPKLSFFKGLKILPQLGGRDIVCLNLSSATLELAYGRISSTRKEVLGLISCNIEGLSDEGISKVIKASLDNSKIAAPEVINIIPAHLTIVKNIEVPSRDPQEIKEIIDLQSGRHTPYAREEIIIDYINIGTYRKSYTKILLIIVTLNTIRRQLAILERANLRTEKIFFAPEVISQACAGILKLESEPSVQTLIHIDSNFTDFINLSKGKLIFIRSIPVGSQHLLVEKERYQGRFIEEVKKSLEAYKSEDIDRPPEEIILTGAVENPSELQGLLSNMLYMPVRVFNYLEHLPISPAALKKTLPTGRKSFLSVTASLIASGSIKANLIPEEIKLRKLFEKKSKDLVKSGIFTMAVFSLICGIAISKIYFKASYLEKLTQKYKPIIQETESLEKDFSKIKLIKFYLKDRGIPLQILTELYNLIPTDIQLNGIKFSLQGKFSVEGNSRTMATVFSFINDMEESKYFKNVESKRSTKRKEDGKELVDFEIVCMLEKNLFVKNND